MGIANELEQRVLVIPEHASGNSQITVKRLRVENVVFLLIDSREENRKVWGVLFSLLSSVSIIYEYSLELEGFKGIVTIRPR